MVADLPDAERLAVLDGASRRALAGSENPIVLLAARAGNGLAAAINPGLDTIGIMLPTTPLHWLLLHDCGRPLIVTSGNCEGEPLCADVDESVARLQEIADLWMHHDRPIVNPLDDSVVRIIAGRAVTLRLARGLAPLVLDLPGARPAAAVGGHQKAAFALATGAQSLLGPHVGDLETLCNREQFVTRMARTTLLYGTTPQLWIHDLHPDYFTSQWVREQPGSHWAVQHHHAHVAAAMLEHGWLDRNVLGVAFDGTGFGPDGTVWGGEFLLASASSFSRVGCLRPFRLPGGEAAIREPWRVAAAIVRQVLGDNDLRELPLDWISGRTRDIRPLLEHETFAPATTSAGRLFDGIAALVLEIQRADFEGAPAMLLEAAVDPGDAVSYRIPLTGGIDGTPIELDWRPLLRELLADLARDVPRAAIAMRFHRGLAAGVAAMCRRFRQNPVVLCGGVFQNRVLCELIVEEVSNSGQELGLPGRIPPNDGGLAAGQLAVGLSFKDRS
jgi:hydrogenase maturation protein HypF